MDLNIKQQATTCWDRRHDTRHETENDCMNFKKGPIKNEDYQNLANHDLPIRL